MQASEQKQDYSNREVKFRAWDKRARKWRVINTLCWYKPGDNKTGLDGAIVADGKSKQGTFMPIEDLEVVQYTGQHSIDKVEVCERDLLRFPGLDETYEVRWNNLKGAWGLFYCGYGSPLLNQYALSEQAINMQIVGSTCENSRLRRTN